MKDYILIKISGLYLLVTFIFLPLNGQGQQDWITYTSNVGQYFEVEVPAEMAVKTKEIKTAVGELNAYTYAHKGTDEEPNYLYLINIIDYPEGAFPVDSSLLINDFLSNAVSSCAEGVGGTLVYDSNIKNKNGIGKLFRIKYNDDFAIIKGKVFLKNDKFITLQVFTTREKSLNSEMDDFLDSFLLIEDSSKI